VCCRLGTGLAGLLAPHRQPAATEFVIFCAVAAVKTAVVGCAAQFRSSTAPAPPPPTGEGVLVGGGLLLLLARPARPAPSPAPLFQLAALLSAGEGLAWLAGDRQACRATSLARVALAAALAVRLVQLLD